MNRMNHSFPIIGFLFLGIVCAGMAFGEQQRSERPSSVAELDQQMITIRGNVQLSKYEVTQALWEAVMGENPSKFQGCAQCPVERVSWNDVQEFLKKLNALTGDRYRLPMEAEWEAAVGSGGGAWHFENSGKRTHPVGQKAPNELGLYDMMGNVLELVEDRLHDVNCPSCRVARGGSWTSSPGFLRSATHGIEPSNASSLFGFRVARTLTP